MNPARKTANSAIINASRSPTEVHRKTEGIKKVATITNLENFPAESLRLCISKSKDRLIVVIRIERRRTERKSGTPKIFIIFAGKYAIQRKIVGAVIHPLAVCAFVPIGNE